jgi:hypothetical protein
MFKASMIAMLVVGGVLLIAFIIYELKFATAPVIAPRLWRNKGIVIGCAIGFFDFISFYLTYSYLSSFVYITQEWSIKEVGYFGNTQSVALTVFGIVAGVIMRLTHRYKVRWLDPAFSYGLSSRVVAPCWRSHCSIGRCWNDDSLSRRERRVMLPTPSFLTCSPCIQYR